MSSSSASASVGAVNCPDFLYAGVVRKLHKRSKTRYQTRRLQFYPDRVDYYKVDGGQRCGSFSLAGVRAEIRLQNNIYLFEFVYDDIKERQFVFTVMSDVVRATMLWIANGEQFNSYGPTVKKLSTQTVEYMQAGKVHSTIRSLISMKYEAAGKHFISTLPLTAGSPTISRDYDEMETLGCERQRISSDSCSSSDDESLHFPMERTRGTLVATKGTPSFESPEELTSNTITKRGTLGSSKGIPSFEMPEEDGYMAFSQLAGLSNPSVENFYETTIPDSKRKTQDKKAQYNIMFNYNNDDKTIDFGAREVNAIKVKLCGHKDFIEIDISQIGRTLDDLKLLLCSEFDITLDDIVCIRKLPDVMIRNDKDVTRIRPGRNLEVEVREE